MAICVPERLFLSLPRNGQECQESFQREGAASWRAKRERHLILKHQDVQKLGSMKEHSAFQKSSLLCKDLSRGYWEMKQGRNMVLESFYELSTQHNIWYKNRCQKFVWMNEWIRSLAFIIRVLHMYRRICIWEKVPKGESDGLEGLRWKIQRPDRTFLQLFT